MRLDSDMTLCYTLTFTNRSRSCSTCGQDLEGTGTPPPHCGHGAYVHAGSLYVAVAILITLTR